ncbi:hypothetical protein [Mycobacterium sp. NPDC050853]|uniref:hypothetical protein n=1 Tax=Mycobacterium sp. NPDC050853 TaxID=3155160 RepID=UPI0033FD4157
MTQDAKTFDRSLSIYSLSSRSRRRTPEELFTELSRDHPVRWDPFASVWLVSRRAEALTVLTDGRFSATRFDHSTDSAADKLSATVHDAISRQALFLDGPEHARWQSILRKTLAKKYIDEMGDWIRLRTTQLLDAHGEGEADMLAMLARPLPLDVVGQLLNLPIAQLPALPAWSDAYTTVVTGFEPTIDPATYQLVADFLTYCHRLVDERGHDDTTIETDGTARFVRAALAVGVDDRLTIASNLMMLISAGHQTTTGFLATVIAQHAGGRLSDDEVEKLLVRISPSRFVGRTVLEDLELGGQQLRAGQSVLVLLAAANWHDSVPVPDSAHLVFGHGKHFCPGAPLARLESQIVLKALFDGSRHLEQTQSACTWNNNVNLPCPVSVPVRISTDDHSSGRTTHA